jgi:hypothetical protein
VFDAARLLNGKSNITILGGQIAPPQMLYDKQNFQFPVSTEDTVAWLLDFCVCNTCTSSTKPWE